LSSVRPPRCESPDTSFCSLQTLKRGVRVIVQRFDVVSSDLHSGSGDFLAVLAAPDPLKRVSGVSRPPVCHSVALLELVNQRLLGFLVAHELSHVGHTSRGMPPGVVSRDSRVPQEGQNR